MSPWITSNWKPLVSLVTHTHTHQLKILLNIFRASEREYTPQTWRNAASDLQFSEYLLWICNNTHYKCTHRTCCIGLHTQKQFHLFLPSCFQSTHLSIMHYLNKIYNHWNACETSSMHCIWNNTRSKFLIYMRVLKHIHEPTHLVHKYFYVQVVFI